MVVDEEANDEQMGYTSCLVDMMPLLLINKMSSAMMSYGSPGWGKRKHSRMKLIDLPRNHWERLTLTWRDLGKMLNRGYEGLWSSWIKRGQELMLRGKILPEEKIQPKVIEKRKT